MRLCPPEASLLAHWQTGLIIVINCTCSPAPQPYFGEASGAPALSPSPSEPELGTGISGYHGGGRGRASPSLSDLTLLETITKHSVIFRWWLCCTMGHGCTCCTMSTWLMVWGGHLGQILASIVPSLQHESGSLSRSGHLLLGVPES